ncbi:MAG: NUDIX domain-containing protein [Gemmatimonas sp.]|nr:NUDIX domain-containing protein [Gemmatimonas sp.]
MTKIGFRRRPKRNRAGQGARRVATEEHIRTPQGATRKRAPEGGIGYHAEMRDLSTACERSAANDPLNDPRIRVLHGVLEQRPPRVLDPDPRVSRAAVSLVVRPGSDDLEILLIQRTASDHDPWSGHMALPGGRHQGDEEDLDTAIRETLEEVGVDLASEGMLIGRLDDVSPAHNGPRIAVAPFVFAVPAQTKVVPEPAEVAETVWIPIRHLADPTSAAEHLHVLPNGGSLRFPAFAYDRYVIWGLTHRMLIQFLGIARTIQQGESS